MVSGKTRLLALIGQPVSHSLSPRMHNAAFAADDLDFVYVCLDVDPDALPDAVKGMVALKLRGFNVTMPHKRAMIPLVDELDEGARISGAVNTVVIEGSTLRGYNTDGGGMVMACEEAGIELSGQRVLILGAGGAAAAITVAFSGVGVGELHIANRSLEHAIELRDKLRMAGIQKVEAHTLDALEEPITEAAVVVNATPLGMKEGDALPPPTYPASIGRVRGRGQGHLRRGLPSRNGDTARPAGARTGSPGRRRRPDAVVPGRAGAEALDRARAKREGDGPRDLL